MWLYYAIFPVEVKGVTVNTMGVNSNSRVTWKFSRNVLALLNLPEGSIIHLSENPCFYDLGEDGWI